MSLRVHPDTASRISDRPLALARRFTTAVRAAEGAWAAPSPCPGWDARGIVEHVIGFHDVLILRPFGAKPHRPADAPQQRWDLTYTALATVLHRDDLVRGPVDIPAIGTRPPARIDLRTLLPMLSQELVVHTWDLARATGGDDQLDPELCAQLLDRIRSNDLTSS